MRNVFHALVLNLHQPSGNLEHLLANDEWWPILRAETSCNFFWGEAWVPRCHQDLDEAWRLLNSARQV